jgi:hypothetical protein
MLRARVRPTIIAACLLVLLPLATGQVCLGPSPRPGRCDALYPYGDCDGDGWMNQVEYEAGCDPGLASETPDHPSSCSDIPIDMGGDGLCNGQPCPGSCPGNSYRASDGNCYCPSGTSWNGSWCTTVTPSCPGNSYPGNDGQCHCPTGTAWNGTSCASTGGGGDCDARSGVTASATWEDDVLYTHYTNNWNVPIEVRSQSQQPDGQWRASLLAIRPGETVDCFEGLRTSVNGQWKWCARFDRDGCYSYCYE